MKSKILLWVFVFQSIILSQTNFIQQITSGDFDARNPFIYKDYYGYDKSLIFELHKNGYSNIYSINYNSTTGTFEDTVAITTGNFININPSFKSNQGLLFQTNKNGNYDIALIPDSNGILGEVKYLTYSLADEQSPQFIGSLYYNTDSTNILFKRDDGIYILTYREDKTSEQLLFQNTNEKIFTEFTGIDVQYWGNFNGVHVYAIEQDQNNVKKIVQRFKPIGGSWGEIETIKDSCDCAELSAQIIDYTLWALTFQDTLQGGKKIFGIDVFANPINIFQIPLKAEGNLSSFNLYEILIVGKRSNSNSSNDYELYSPHTYSIEQSDKIMIRADLSELGFWGQDSLIETSVLKPDPMIGPLGSDSKGMVIYTVWEDSSDGHIQLFGTKQHMSYGAVGPESYVDDFVLYQNYPNPFNPNTKIDYKIFKGSNVKFEVINILGEKVYEENYGYQMPGIYNIDFNGVNLSSGIYFYSIITDENKLSRKMILLK